MHIRTKVRKGEETNLENYKHFNSIVWLAVVDAECEILFSDIGSPGRMGDSRVSQTGGLESFVKALPPVNVPGPEGITKYVIVGDSAFPLSEEVLAPFRTVDGIASRLTFNNRLSHGRQVVERAFGQISQRFRILKKHQELTAPQMVPILHTCALLHNFISAARKCNFDADQLGAQIHQIQSHAALDAEINSPEPNGAPVTDEERTQRRERVREIFSEYFLNNPVESSVSDSL